MARISIAVGAPTGTAVPVRQAAVRAYEPVLNAPPGVF